MIDPVSGPIPRDVFATLAAEPHGQALRIIQQYDPLYGRKEGEKLRWKVTLRREIPDESCIREHYIGLRLASARKSLTMY